MLKENRLPPLCQSSDKVKHLLKIKSTTKETTTEQNIGYLFLKLSRLQ